jgi:hypothetical protein
MLFLYGLTVQICNVLGRVALKENISLPDAFALRVAEKSGGNLRKALLMLEAAKVKQLSIVYTLSSCISSLSSPHLIHQPSLFD